MIIIHALEIIGALVVVATFGALVLGAYALAAYGNARDDLEGIEIDCGQVHDVNPRP